METILTHPIAFCFCALAAGVAIAIIIEQVKR